MMLLKSFWLNHYQDATDTYRELDATVLQEQEIKFLGYSGIVSSKRIRI